MDPSSTVHENGRDLTTGSSPRGLTIFEDLGAGSSSDFKRFSRPSFLVDGLPVTFFYDPGAGSLPTISRIWPERNLGRDTRDSRAPHLARNFFSKSRSSVTARPIFFKLSEVTRTDQGHHQKKFGRVLTTGSKVRYLAYRFSKSHYSKTAR